MDQLVQKKLPNATTALILGIVSFIGCCCTSGFGGIVLSGIALFLIKKDEKLYAEDPDAYSNFGQLKTAKIITIIGLVISIIIVIIYLYLMSTGQLDEMRDQYMDVLKEMQENQ
ncbi:CCC motif membrane protein [Psychroserpens jangbogonensis]|uniref:CCC motif membrane protein n=1 Tax=Psychroserpens jangbogonensis TaxID=1484460 RepID=UPI00053D14B0|nr:CCC motif membrane protein [Psychroserpens jangbogonensis]